MTLRARECLVIGTIVPGPCPHGTGCNNRICTQHDNAFIDFHEGDLEVHSGEVLIVQSGAQIKGSIKVTGGLLIVRESSFIDGNLENESGNIYLNGTTITGNIIAEGNKSGSATIINSDVGGEIHLTGLNTAKVEDNVIGGNIHSLNNTALSLKDNTINGN